MSELTGDATAQQLLQEERALARTPYALAKMVAEVQQTGRVVLRGLQGGWLALVVQDLLHALGRPGVVVLPRAEEAPLLFEAMESFRVGPGRRLLLPAPETSPYAGITPDRGLMLQRMSAWRQLRNLEAGDIVVTSALAWARRSTPPEVLDAATRTLARNEELDAAALATLLNACGWSSVGIVEDPGTFSIRGDLVDVFPPWCEEPVRIELYGDLIETIRVFDPATQRSGGEIDEVIVGPIREEVQTPEALATARLRLSELGETLRIPSSRIGAVLRDLNAGHRFFGIETLLPAFFSRLAEMDALLGPDVVRILVEPDAALDDLEVWHHTRQMEYDRELAAGEPVFAPHEWACSAEDVRLQWETSRTQIHVVNLGVLPEGAISLHALDNSDVVRARAEHASEGGGVQAALAAIEPWRSLYARLVLLCGSRGAADRAAHWVERHGGRVYRHPGQLDLSSPDGTHLPGDAAGLPGDPTWEVAVGPLRAGFRHPGRGVALISDRELIGRAGRRSGREAVREAAAVSTFRDLVPGDLVVHTDFGVGRYLGMERLDAGGIFNDFLAIEYADRDKLYVPVYRLARVGKYVGAAQFTRLDKMGGTSWDKTKEKVKSQLADLANDLLRVQAERASRKGYQYSAPDELYETFEAAFPYEETQGQLDAIHDVLGDMMSERPMDRLLCGDVGFGKTEVAVRAAYKAVVDGRQVAVLVPTTVLAEQHMKSFRERLAGTPARVESLSRFRTPAEVQKTLDAASLGQVDVLIGTHRLLSKDVRFKDLGLLIVDEEQRFGVAHKERLKQLRTTVDVLTMTATPIPRTLEMSMLGIRDLSVILTPPAGRLAVRTHVARYKENVLREGIQQELDRGGQVFFVHNRVETIHNIASELERIVPDARIAVAHAQMPDKELEAIMMSFLRRETNVLVTTTIIESGIDIASANTIFINDADRFGLSQLHQLRGRVGRGSDRAYCWLLVKDINRLPADARRRLEVIQEHAELGAGLQIAHQDLDMRGAGSVLGRDQSGQIESIGMELFQELLQEAIADIRGEPAEEAYEAEVKIPVQAYLPDTYVQDVSQRLGFYKRFSLVQSHEELEELVAELHDRYGRPPEAVEALRDVIGLKLRMQRIRARRIEAGPRSVVVELRPDTVLDPARLMALLQSQPGRWEFRPDMVLVRWLKGPESQHILASAIAVAQEVEACMVRP